MIRGKRPFRSSYDSREDSHWGRDTSSLGTSAIIPALCSVLTYYSRIMLSAYLLFPHYAQCLPIIPALCSVLTYYSRIMLNAFWYLLFSKLCQHNPPNPNPQTLCVIFLRKIRYVNLRFYSLHTCSEGGNGGTARSS